MLASNLGTNSAALARSREIIGAIVDGPVTGVAGIRGHDFPVWCRGGTTVTGHYRVETVEINGTVACGGVQVSPGDLVVADDSGVTIVPGDLVGEVLEGSLRLAEKGRAMASAVTDGAQPGQIRETLRRLMDG
jgi:regulator of RNase E activity RraA